LAKKKLEKSRREVTRRQRSRLQQQKRRQCLILVFAIVIVVAVLGVIGIGVYQGWYVSKYKPLHEVVIEVNETEFDMEYYTKMLEFYTRDMSADYVPFMASYVVELIERDELVRQEAIELGITVSDDEVDEELKKYDPPLSKDYRDIARTKLLLEKMRDEYFDEQFPEYVDQRHVMAMFLESEAQANEVITRLEAGEDFGELAAELSLDSVTKQEAGDLGWCPLGALPLMVESDILEESAFGLEVGVLSSPIYEETKTKSVGYWLIEVISVDYSAQPAEADVRVMLLGSEQEANDIIARLEAGEDFGELAGEYSLHTDSKEEGGQLIVYPDTITTAFDDYVFSDEVELDTLSQPIRDDEVSSTGGYWLIKIVESEADRQVSEEIQFMLRTNAVNRWVEELMDDPENNLVSYLDEEKIQWAISYVIGG
jgi:parvulin-like peptidyl-prolyl isomerase